ncbi:MAG TPA: hypothetical protein VFY23_00795 [Candidatus Limnocylindrales bacterium]|nr:hypothetical protein [Candidatus Limnocylindrales bacterium]
MSDPIAQPGDRDPGIEHATDEVVEAWRQGSEGKDPAATEGDFARMREGFGEVAASGRGDADSAGGGDFATTSTREAQLRHAEEADEGSTAANRASTGAGPDG